MKRAGCIDHPGASGASSRKLDHGLDTFAARAAEKAFFQSATTSFAQLGGKLASEFRDVTLQHCRTGPRKFGLQGSYYARMIVSRIVNAISGKEIENAAAVVSK